MEGQPRPRPVVLCVLCGVGEGDGGSHDAVALANTPTLDHLRANYPSTWLDASGAAVGLPAGTAGHGERGHLTIGAGRAAASDRWAVDDLIERRKVAFNEVIDQTLRICLYDSCPLHLVALLSDAGGHGDMDHLGALIDAAAFNEIPIVIHGILDGRDTPAKSALDYLDRLDMQIAGKNVVIGTLSGRHYAMDSEGRWDRTYQVFHAMVRDKLMGPVAPQAENVFEAVSASYRRGIFDEELEPVRIGEYRGFNGDYMCDFAAPGAPWVWTGEDVGMVLGLRPDSSRQLVSMLTRKGLPSEVADDLLMDRHFPMLGFRDHCLATLTSSGDDIDVPVVIPSKRLPQTLGEVVANAGLTQLRCAEAIKATHVTRYFSGHRDEPFSGETRKVVPPSLLIDNYEDKPAMRADRVAKAVVEAIDAGSHDLIVVSLANGDVVGHSGKLDATVEAVEAVDTALGRILEATRKVGGALFVVADHGNCEAMVDAKGRPHRSHTTNRVPFIYANDADDARLGKAGSLQDVAPTVLEVLGIEQPEAMSGRSLRLGDNATEG